MFNFKKLMSVALAGVITISSVCVNALMAFADSSTDSIEMTFDGKYDMTDRVYRYGLFYPYNDDVQEKLEAALKRKFPGKELDEVTFGDLAKVTTLDLSGLGLVDVPTCINYMTNLTKLDLSSNYLQSDALKKLSLLGCTKLSNIDLSDNYLTSIPSWFLSDRVTRGDITNNFVDSENPRRITVSQSTYYLMDGEIVEGEDFKNQILKSVRMNDGKMLPELFFGYNDDPLNQDGYITITPDDFWESFVVDEVVVAPTNRTVTVTVRMFNELENDNNEAEVTIYLLSGKDIASLKNRLNSLVEEYEAAYSKEIYTESSWDKYERALDTAKAILKYADADVQMLAKALEGLSNAASNLHYGTKDLQDTMKDLITVGGKYKQDQYTPSSWKTFSDALDRLKTISVDKDAKLEEAQKAVKNFQNAQAGLTSAQLKVPEKILKSEFEKIYGENASIKTEGITVEGTRYKWFFKGKELTAVKDFSPEVKDTDAAESDILIEAGGISSYRLFATAQKDALPGKAVLELDVSEKNFVDGLYYLYKWDSGAKRSTMVDTVQVKNGIANVPLTEGGVYYISPNIQNFNLVSSKYKVDDAKKMVIVLPTMIDNVSSFKNSFEYGKYTSVLDADGKGVSSNSRLKTGMTVNAPNMDKYTITIVGDTNFNSIFELEDVTNSLDTFLAETAGENLAVYDADGNGTFELNDVVILLDYYLQK